MNKVILIGRLTRDPDCRQTQNSFCARFSLAVDRKYNKSDHPEADFPSVVAWGKTAEFIQKYFRKGMKMGLEGRIQTGSYTNREGVKVYTTDIVAESVEFVEKKSANGGSAAQTQTPPPETDDSGWMDVPEGVDEELPFA